MTVPPELNLLSVLIPETLCRIKFSNIPVAESCEGIENRIII